MTRDEAVSKVVTIAQAELGYKEKRTNQYLDDPEKNAGTNNWNKFARDLDKLGYYNGRKNIGIKGEWCDIFVDWCVTEAFGFPTGRDMLYQPPKSTGAGAVYSAGFFKAKKAWYNMPEAADQIFFLNSSGSICHTGIVERVENGTVHTIEGNAQNMVSRHAYMIGNGRIAGYGRPNWKLVAEETTPSTPKTHSTLSKGSKGEEVKEMQEALMSIGYQLPIYGADGDFGSETEGAVCNFQRDHKPLTVDGICGPLTWAALDEAVQKATDQTGATVEPGDPVKYLIYTVKPGDTLIKIAVQHRTTSQALAFVNGIKNPNRIFVGQKIRIPV